jgi:hypothetical protein
VHATSSIAFGAGLVDKLADSLCPGDTKGGIHNCECGMRRTGIPSSVRLQASINDVATSVNTALGAVINDVRDLVRGASANGHRLRSEDALNEKMEKLVSLLQSREESAPKRRRVEGDAAEVGGGGGGGGDDDGGESTAQGPEESLAGRLFIWGGRARMVGSRFELPCCNTHTVWVFYWMGTKDSFPLRLIPPPDLPTVSMNKELYSLKVFLHPMVREVKAAGEYTDNPTLTQVNDWWERFNKVLNIPTVSRKEGRPRNMQKFSWKSAVRECKALGRYADLSKAYVAYNKSAASGT